MINKSNPKTISKNGNYIHDKLLIVFNSGDYNGMKRNKEWQIIDIGKGYFTINEFKK